MAVPAQTRPQERSLQSRKVLSGIQHLAVRLYSDGKTRSQVAKLLGPRVWPGLDQVEAAKKMRVRLRRWEETQWFRDAVYDSAMILTDMDIPRVLNGVRARARRGRTDAARLVLEVTGRHNPKGESSAPAVVQISFGGDVPRPQSRIPEAKDQPGLEAPIDGQAEEIEDAEIVAEPSNSPAGRASLRQRFLSRIR